MKIIFNNGKELNVSKDIAQIIADNILKLPGAKQWQVFIENGKSILMVNLNEVAYIIDESAKID